MMERKINGKSPGEVLEALKAPFEFVREKDGNFYIPAPLVQERFDEVCGLNWSFVPTKQPEVVQSEGKSYVLTDGKICIFDDEGKLYTERGQSGGVEVIIVNQTGKVKNLADNYKAAVSGCFKKCAEMFGVGRHIAIDSNTSKLIKYPKNRGNNAGKNNKSSNPTPNSNKDQQNQEAGKKEEYKKPADDSKGNENTIIFTVTGKVKETKTFTKIPVKHQDGREGVLMFWTNFLLDNPDYKTRISKIELNEELKVDSTRIQFDENDFKGELQFIAKAAA